jgi:hypothetical protein
LNGVQTNHLNCSRCGLTIKLKASWLTIEHCPRCIARNGVAISRFASSLPTGELYATGGAPHADRLDARRSRSPERMSMPEHVGLTP